MEVRLAGTGGARGWPQPDCRCASCARARPAGRHRAPTQVLVDGVLRVDGGERPVQAPGAGTPGAAGYRVARVPGGGEAAGYRVARVPGGGEAAGYRVARVPGGWDVTGPDRARLLMGDGPGDRPGDGPADGRGVTPPEGTRPYDIALLDLLGNPAQLGALRRRGLVHGRTVIAVLHADHRVRSEQELARRCGYWGGVIAPHDGDVLAATAGPGPAGMGAAGPGPAGMGAAGTGTMGTRASDVRSAGPAGGPGGPGRVLVLGGARSGKSRHAELRLAGEPRVTYLAAGPYPAGPPPADAEWAGRVAAHRARRPAWWDTVEGTGVAGILRSESGAVLFDGAGTWLAAVMEESGAWAGDGEHGDAGPAALARVAARVEELLGAWRQTRARVVAVSDEVGSGVHPATRPGRAFRDQLGWLNQRLAAESEETVLMVAGRAVTLPG